MRTDTVDKDIPRELEVFREGGRRREQVVLRRRYTLKKRFASFPSLAGMSLPNSPWAGITTS
jgi:hypothetical protein